MAGGIICKDLIDTIAKELKCLCVVDEVGDVFDVPPLRSTAVATCLIHMPLQGMTADPLIQRMYSSSGRYRKLNSSSSMCFHRATK